MPVVRSRRAVIRLGATGLAAAALIAGCGGEERRGSLSAPPRAPEGRRAGNLRIGSVVPNTDPLGLSDAVYSRLVALDPRDGSLYGDLARDLEVADEGLTVRVRLREGMRFHPGPQNLARSLTAEDVRRESEARAAAGDYLFASVVERVETPDIHTVVLHMRAPFSLLFDYLGDTTTGAVRSGQHYTIVDAPIGSGPFVPAARERAGTTLVANPLYYRERLPQLERLYVFAGGEPRDLAAAVAADELDVALHQPDALLEQVRPPQGAPVTTVRRASRRLRALGFSIAGEKAGGVRTRSAPAFGDARVRRAASLALDRGAILALDDADLAGPVGPAHASDALSREELGKHPLYRRDVEEARRLLAAAGVPELSFALEGANRPQTRAVAQLVEKQLREAGFQPRTRLLPVADWERLFLAGDFEAALVELDELRTPDLGLRICTSGGVTGKFSLWGFSSPAFDAAARAAFTVVDPRQRGERAREAQRLLLDEVPPLLPLSAPPDYATLADRVQGFEFDAFELNTGWNSAVWRLGEKKQGGG